MNPQVIGNAALLAGTWPGVLLQGILTGMDRALLGYLAGCVDCDGSISANRQRRKRADGSTTIGYIVRVTVAQKNRNIPELFKYNLGGNLYYYDAKQRPQTGGWWQWYVAGPNASTVLRLLRSHLHLKRVQADLALELAELITKRGRTFGGRPLSERELGAREELAARIREFNVRRTPAIRNGRQDVHPLSGTHESIDHLG